MIDVIQSCSASSVRDAATDAPLWVQPTSSSVSSACLTLDIARATFYRNRFTDALVDPDLNLRDRIQKIALDWPSYDYRRITAQLRRDRLKVNHKLILRLMREDNLLCLRKTRFRIATTDSSHGLPISPNLAKKLLVTRCDQLWVSDITYIRLRHEFVYLAVVIDAFSRKVIGWALSRRIDSALAMAALDMALAARRPQPDTLIHHSDRGSQYASAEYVERLQDNKIAVSMSRKGMPQDNAFAESFMKALKYEEVYMTEYDNIADARDQIGYFLEEVYNKKRLHSALGYLPPTEFETNVSKYKRTAP